MTCKVLGNLVGLVDDLKPRLEVGVVRISRVGGDLDGRLEDMDGPVLDPLVDPEHSLTARCESEPTRTRTTEHSLTARCESKRCAQRKWAQWIWASLPDLAHSSKRDMHAARIILEHALRWCRLRYLGRQRGSSLSRRLRGADAEMRGPECPYSGWSGRSCSRQAPAPGTENWEE